MYILNPEINTNKLHKYGFSRLLMLNISVYKKSIVMRMNIENDESGKPKFEYEVWDYGKRQLYYPYYYHEFGRDSVLETVQKNVRKELKRLVRDEILLEVSDEEDCKI